MTDTDDHRDESDPQPEEHQATQRGEEWESQEEDAQSTIDDVQEGDREQAPGDDRGGDVQIEGEQYGEAEPGKPGTPTEDEQANLDEEFNQYGGGDDAEDAADQTRRRDEEQPMEQESGDDG